MLGEEPMNARLGSYSQDSRDAREAAALSEMIAGALRTRRERARRIIDRCLERVPHYRGLPDALMEEVFESTVYHQTIFYEVTLSEGRSLSAQELEPGRATARSRARLGVPLGEYLLFFQEGLALIVEDLVDSAGADEGRGALLGRLPRIISNQTQLMTALTEAYVEERERLSHYRDQDLYDFFELLVHREGGESPIEVRARALGISLAESNAVLLFHITGATGAADGSAGLEALRQLVSAAAGEAPCWVGRSRDGFAALLGGELDVRALEDGAAGLLGEDVRIGVGRPGAGVAGARRSAKEALRAVRIGAMMDRTRAIHSYADVEILDLVGIGSEASEDFMRRVLGRLALPDAAPTHVETLWALALHGFAIKAAAESLSVHPHTLSYRIKQIRNRHGIDLDDPGTRMRVHLALLIRDAVVPPTGDAPKR